MGNDAPHLVMADFHNFMQKQELHLCL